MKETSSQVSVSSTELLQGNQIGGAPVQSLNDSEKPKSEIQRKEIDMTTDDKGDDNITPPVITNHKLKNDL